MREIRHLNQSFKVGDMLYCIIPYAETEVGYNFRRYMHNGVLTHLTKNKQYKIEDISIEDTNLNDVISILIMNDFGKQQWYNLNMFVNIKEQRRLKLKKLKSL